MECSAIRSALNQAPGFDGWKGFVECSLAVDAEIVLDQNDGLGVTEDPWQVAQLLTKVDLVEDHARIEFQSADPLTCSP